MWKLFQNDTKTIPKLHQNDVKTIPNNTKTIPKRRQKYSKTTPKQYRTDSKTTSKQYRNDTKTIPKQHQNNTKTMPLDGSRSSRSRCTQNMNLNGALGFHFETTFHQKPFLVIHIRNQTTQKQNQHSGPLVTNNMLRPVFFSSGRRPQAPFLDFAPIIFAGIHQATIALRFEKHLCSPLTYLPRTNCLIHLWPH